MKNLILVAALFCAGPARAYDLIQFQPPLRTDPSLKPSAVAAAGERVYALDADKNRLGIFTADGGFVRAVGRSGDQTDGFSNPRRLAVGPDGSVFVADTGNNRVQILDAEGNFTGQFGTPGSEPGHLDSPEGIAVGSDGRVFVADTGNHRIQVFTREGIFLFGFGSKGGDPGLFKDPAQVLIDDSDNIIVMDLGNDRVQKFDPRTRFVRDLPLQGQDIAQDAYGFLYMLDEKRGKVKEFSPEGSLLGEFGSLGSGQGQFKKPRDIAVAPDGAVLVADTANGRIQRVSLTNKAKTARLRPNLALKLMVAGPSAMYTYPASAMASFRGTVYAFVEKLGQFVGLDASAKEVLRFGKKAGKGPSTTRGCGGFAVSSLGIFSSDTPSSRVQAFDAKGSFKTSFGEAQGMFSGGQEGTVSEPMGVAVNEKGTVYVADASDRRVSAFSPDGAFLFSFGPSIGQFELKRPVGAAFDPAGFIYVLDQDLRKVFKCEPSGGFVSAWGEEGEGVGQFLDPVAIAFDGKTYLYVLDRKAARVSVFDKDGNWVTNFFSRGTGEQSLKEPSALTVSGARLFISDPGQNRIVAFSLKPQIAPPTAISTGTAAGQAFLQWEEQKDPWIDNYRVYRSTRASGPFSEVGRVSPSAQPHPAGEASSAGFVVFRDTAVTGPQNYFYKVAVQAETGDLGPASPPVFVAVAASVNRAAVEISSITIGNIFSANYKWYLKNPLGKAVLKNNMNAPYQNVKLAFRLKDFMDFATEQSVENLPPQQTVELPLMATLNNRILEVSEDTPIQAEFTATYFEGGRKQTVSRTQALKVYSRNAITWEDPRRIANFITPKDPPVLELGREALRKAPKGPDSAEFLNHELVLAMHLWDALGAIGVRYLPSPNNPFETISEDPAFPLDYTQFPRETIKRKSGQCDDLVTLLSSMMEAATVRTAVLDYPGHMAMMFDTGATEPEEAGLPADHLIKFQGTMWIPLEATLVGSPFDEAVDKALYAYKDMLKDGKVAIIDPREGWQTYEPATLPAVEWRAESPSDEAVAKSFAPEAESFLKLRFDYLSGKLQKRLAKDPSDADALNALGVVCFEHGKTLEAEGHFKKVLEIDPGNAAAQNNLGSLAYLAGRFDEAMKMYQAASESDPEDAVLWMNMARAAVKLEQRALAEDYAKKAVELESSMEPVKRALLK